jgi:rubrerythrin
MAFAWEKQAASGEPMPDGFPLSEQKAYQSIACLYVRFKAGAINQDGAVREKHQIEMQLKKEISDETYRDNLAYHQARVNRMTEAAKTQYRKAPTEEHGKKLLEVLDGIDRDDPVMDAIRMSSGAMCPVCGYAFNSQQVLSAPRFCENCGCRLGWGKH